jgi:hypothetical protein
MRKVLTVMTAVAIMFFATLHPMTAVAKQICVESPDIDPAYSDAISAADTARSAALKASDETYASARKENDDILQPAREAWKQFQVADPAGYLKALKAQDAGDYDTILLHPEKISSFYANYETLYTELLKKHEAAQSAAYKAYTEANSVAYKAYDDAMVKAYAEALLRQKP